MSTRARRNVKETEPRVGRSTLVPAVALGLLLTSAPVSAHHCKGDHANDPGCPDGGGGDVVFEIEGAGDLLLNPTASNPVAERNLNDTQLVFRQSFMDLTFLDEALDGSDGADNGCFDPGACVPVPGPSGGCTIIVEASDRTLATVHFPFKARLQGGSTRVSYTLTLYGMFDEPGNWFPGVFAAQDETVVLDVEGWEVEAVKNKDRRTDCGGGGNFLSGAATLTVRRLP